MEIREELCNIGKRMYEKNLIVAGDGNISYRVSDEEIWVTPSGVSKGFLLPNQLACVDINGNMQNEHKPSSELKMHLNIYRQRNDVKAIVHAHPVFATAYAVCGKPLDKKYITEAVVSLGEVPVTQFALPSSQDLADSCNPYIQDYQALLLANHGALTWDRTLEAALFKLETIEQLAKISFLAEAMHAKELTLQQVNKLIALRAVYDL